MSIATPLVWASLSTRPSAKVVLVRRSWLASSSRPSSRGPRSPCRSPIPAQRIYGARSIHFSAKAQRQLERIERHGWSKFPVCIAKTQYSFSDDPTAYGSVRDFDLEVRDVVINTGAEMIVLVLGALVRMPGLPRVPQAEKIDFIDGHIEGLS